MSGLLLCLLLATASHAASLTGVVAEEDIHHGPRIAGASVWIDGVASTTSSAEGIYLFEGLASGSYTVHATADGYLEGTCSKTIDESTVFWCSIALQVDPGGDDTGDPGDDTGDPGDDTGDPGDDTGDPDTGTPDDDTGSADTAAPGTFPPGAWTPMYGCHAARVAPGFLLGLLGLLGLTRRRRP
ncbi:MAG: carboxypeptidase-like regulatory domain-containing protein [Pseudomonadota bacterium]